MRLREREEGWQSRNLLATPASCQHCRQRRHILSFPSSVSSICRFLFPVFAARETKGRGNRRGQTEHVMRRGSEAASHVCLIVCASFGACVCVRGVCTCQSENVVVFEERLSNSIINSSGFCTSRLPFSDNPLAHF